MNGEPHKHAHLRGSQQFAIFPLEWIPHLPNPTAQTVFLVLCAHAGYDGMSYPSITRIASLTGLHARNITRALRDLEAAGAVITTAVSGKSSSYRVLPPPELSTAPGEISRGSQEPQPLAKSATTPLAKSATTPLAKSAGLINQGINQRIKRRRDDAPRPVEKTTTITTIVASGSESRSSPPIANQEAANDLAEEWAERERRGDNIPVEKRRENLRRLAAMGLDLSRLGQRSTHESRDRARTIEISGGDI